MIVASSPHYFTSLYLTTLHRPCAVSMTGCWATVIRAGWYRQRTQRPLMFSPPGQIFLAHLEWERTGINMATWQSAWEAVVQSEPATDTRTQEGNQLFLSVSLLLYLLNSWTVWQKTRGAAFLLTPVFFLRSRVIADNLINHCVILPSPQIIHNNKITHTIRKKTLFPLSDRLFVHFLWH